MEAEFADPPWTLDRSSYGFLPDGAVVAVARSGGRDHLYRIEPGALVAELEMPFTELEWLRVGAHAVVALAGRAGDPSVIARFDPVTLAPAGVLRRATTVTFDPAIIAEPESIEFPTTGDRTAHALYYPPTNPDFRGPDGEKPPLIVLSHGGPTSNASTSLDLGKQFLTSRGIAIVAVDYGGSTGYGREYRRRLDGQWGVVDVDDCVAAAQYLVERGDVDPDRLAIEGGSAGGYTTLAALAFRDVFAAGISLYGIGDLELLETDSHKFESQYNQRLLGPYPEAAALYRERSPSNFPDRFSSPVLILQGLDDRVVPPIPGRVDRRRPVREVDPVRLPRVRGRGPRVPWRVRAPAHARGADRRSSARSSASNRPTRTSHSRCPGSMPGSPATDATTSSGSADREALHSGV